MRERVTLKGVRCSKCKEIKKAKEFYTRPWGYNSWCKSCGREQYLIKTPPKTWWGARQRDERREKDYAEKRARCLKNTKKKRVCCECNKLKNIDKFHKNQYRCKDCRKL